MAYNLCVLQGYQNVIISTHVSIAYLAGFVGIVVLLWVFYLPALRSL